MAAAKNDFDLDISVVDEAPVIADLMNDTSDTCGSTCHSACVSS
jgi:FxLD family lantipeptide